MTKAQAPSSPAGRPEDSRVQPRSLRDEIAARLEEAIITGFYRPGERLVERRLTAQFGVSSIPVREALQELEARGLVSRRPNHGCSVIRLSPEEAASIARLRGVLEPKVVEWAAEQMTPAAGAALREQLGNLGRAARAGDLPAFFHEDLRFHKMIWEVSGNRYAVRALEAAVGSLFASGLVRGTARGTLDLCAEVEQHERMLNALLAGDGCEAARILLAVAERFAAQLPPPDNSRPR